jgi:nucleoside-diphosphate-sugar epimerase
MKMLITGGGGFVGRNVARCLRKLGHEVLAPTHEELDMTNAAKCMMYFDANPFDAIVHTAFKGHFSAKNEHQDFVDNIRMYENLVQFENYRPVIIIGSGAEFDRRRNISFADETELLKRWPVDLYGLSKNIIAKRALGIGTLPPEDENEIELHDPYVLRLFGCFGPDEPDFRFIKRSIIRLKQGLPIEIEKNIDMDFFFVDDIATVIEHVLKPVSSDLRNVNLVYEEAMYGRKYSLAEVGVMICQAMNIEPNVSVKYKAVPFPRDHSYTGNGFKLKKENLPLIGLKEGIARMVKELV